jgi:hypothetical protein
MRVQFALPTVSLRVLSNLLPSRLCLVVATTALKGQVLPASSCASSSRHAMREFFDEPLAAPTCGSRVASTQAWRDVSIKM